MTQALTSEKALPELLTVAGLSSYLGIPVSTIHYWRGRGQGPPALKVGRRLMFRSSDVVTWLDEQAASSKVTTEPRLPREGGEAQLSRGPE